MFFNHTLSVFGGLFRMLKKLKGISKYAIVKTSMIGKNVHIGEFSVVENNVVLGDDVIIHPHVIINQRL
jgi:UDP-3-O-[3-hydroxymyristoyl] glucosamine N-acyltransferase